MLVLDALVRPAFVLILDDTADQLVILLQEPLDGLLVDLRLASQPVWDEGHRHRGQPGWNPVPGPRRSSSSCRQTTAAAATHDGAGPTLSALIGSSRLGGGNRRNVVCDWARRSDGQGPCARSGIQELLADPEKLTWVQGQASAPCFLTLFVQSGYAGAPCPGHPRIVAGTQISGSKSPPLPTALLCLQFCIWR